MEKFDKIKKILHELRFETHFASDGFLCVLHRDAVSYIVSIQYGDNLKSSFRKLKEKENIEICSSINDLEKIFESITDEFKCELRKSKIVKILND